MSAAHTPGQLAQSHRKGADGMHRTEIFSAEYGGIATCEWTPKNLGNGVTGTYREANARRLVACWNACDGLDTQGLEDMTKIGESIKAMQGRAITRQLELEHQLDKATSELAEIKAEANTNQKWAFLEWRQKAEIANENLAEALDQRDQLRTLAKQNAEALGAALTERNELSTALGTSTANYATLAEKLAQAESQRDALLKAARRAVVTLAHAAEDNPIYKDDYDLLSDAISTTTRTPS